MTLSIVTLSYNTLDLILECVGSLQKLYKAELENKIVEIIVVDNASKTATVEGVEKELGGLPGVKLIKSQENLGFGRGCNLGAENAKGDFVLFLNSDTKTSDRGFLEMTEFLKSNPKVGVLGGKLKNFDGSPQASVGKFYNLFNFFVMLFGLEKFGFLRSSPGDVCKVDWVSGACMMVNKSIFEKIGGFDKIFFMYIEDMELCYRAKKQNYLTYYYPKVSVFHKEQGSSNRTFAVVNIYKGLLYFYKIHKSRLEYNIVKVSLKTKALGVYLLGKITNNSYYISTYGQALEIFK
ncbi:MAG: glycosyltransferase family 2 protein [Patescibacteria group bacterium]